MTSLLGKLFGKGKKPAVMIDDIVEDVVMGVIEHGKFDLSYEISLNDEDKLIEVELFGEDETLLKERDGQFLDAMQLLIARVAQHQFPDDRYSISVDCDGYRQEASLALVKLAEKLKGIVLKKEKSVYFRALPPKDRKVIHQYLADDDRIKSHSVGEGLYKKIKIYPANFKSSSEDKETPATK